ncbi:MAG TPA: hypothetical protein VIG74_03950, partial [Alphaproteobacteria bacterium]
MKPNVPEEKNVIRVFYAGLAGGLALIALVLALSAFTLVRYESTLRNLDAALLEKMMQERASGDVTVVALGNSRLRNALAAEGEGKVKLLKFASDFGDLASYDDLLIDVLNARPDILVIQKPLLTVRGKSQAGLLTGLSDMAYFWLDQTIKRQDAESYWHETRDTVIEDCLPAFTGGGLAETLARVADHYDHDMDPASNVNVELSRIVVEKALEKGSKVVILDIPANTGAIETLGVPLHMLDYNGLGRSPERDELLPGL